MAIFLADALKAHHRLTLALCKHTYWIALFECWVSALWSSEKLRRPPLNISPLPCIPLHWLLKFMVKAARLDHIFKFLADGFLGLLWFEGLLGSVAVFLNSNIVTQPISDPGSRIAILNFQQWCVWSLLNNWLVFDGVLVHLFDYFSVLFINYKIPSPISLIYLPIKSKFKFFD